MGHGRVDVDVDGGNVRVTLSPPSAIPGLADRLAVTSSAWARPPGTSDAARPPVVLATATPSSSGGAAAAASLAVVWALRDGPRGGALWSTLRARERRGPTLLASEPARALERELNAGLAGAASAGDRSDAGRAAARGRICWLSLDADDEPDEALERLSRCVAAALAAGLVVAHARRDCGTARSRAPRSGPPRP